MVLDNPLYQSASADLAGAVWLTVQDAGAFDPGSRPGYEFRREFSTGAQATCAELVVTAHGVYEAFLNGERIGDQELTPGLTSYGSTLQVQRYDVAPLLRHGLNELRLIVSDGWFRGRCGASRIADNFGTQIACLARLDVTTDADAVQTIVTDSEWQVAASSIIRADLMDGQRTDLRLVGAEKWRPVAVLDDNLTRNRDRLVESSAPPVRRTATYPAKSVTRLASGRQIVDFGTTVNGWTRLVDLGAEGTTTTITHREWLLPNGDLDMDHAAYPRWPYGGTMPLGQRDTVTSRGNPHDVFEPRHTTHGFRYVGIDGRDDDISLESVEAVLVRSDLRSTLNFRTTDERLNRLHDITVQSWLVNSCDVPTDCPQRERWGYTGDFQIFIHTAVMLEDVDMFTRKWLRSLADDQQPSGLVTNVAPYCGEDPIIPEPLHGAAGWGDSATVIPWELYRAYGDVEILRSNIDMMTRWVDYVTERAAHHRHPSRVERSPEPQPFEQFIWDTGWQWGEWAEPDTTFDSAADQGIVATAYFSRSARILAAALKALDREEEASRYSDLADRVAEAWRLEFVEPESGRLSVDRQAHYVRALAFGLVEPHDRVHMADRLVSLIEQADGHLTTGFLSTGLLLPTLAEAGHIETAYELLLQESEPSWLVMLERGATAIWEVWNGVDENGRAHDSLAHYSKGAVVSFLYEFVAGLRQHPGSAGWEHFTVRPQPGPGIDAAELGFDSPRGRIEISWRTRAEGDVELVVTVPSGSTADLILDPEHPVRVGAGTHRLEGIVKRGSGAIAERAIGVQSSSL